MSATTERLRDGAELIRASAKWHLFPQMGSCFPFVCLLQLISYLGGCICIPLFVKYPFVNYFSYTFMKSAAEAGSFISPATG